MSKSKERIRESQLRYKQGLGQNFIYDDDLLQALVDSAMLQPDEDVLEVGPGAGSLTKHLCDAAGHVTSVELDERLIPLLNAFLADKPNFTLLQGDIMSLNLAEITADFKKPFSVVANIPYYITTPLITMLLSSGLPLRQLALMVQKEVADKILAAPGDEAWCPLSIRCQYLCEPELAMDVPARCFTPAPKVDSAFVLLPLRETPAVAVQDEELFFRVVQAAFALRRKTMVNNLCATFRMERADAVAAVTAAGLDERIRGEKLTMEELAALTDALLSLQHKKEDAQ